MNFLDISSPILIPAIVAIFVGGAAGALGSFMVLKRMALVGDALTHVALPGMGIGLLLGFDPFWGALVVLVVSVIGIWWLQEHTEISFEAIVGIFFASALALGTLLVPNVELIESLFGDIGNLSLYDAVLSVVLALGIGGAIFFLARAIILSTISKDLAQVSGINVSITNLLYLILVALVVALGVKFVGALLMGSLVIVPAAAARNVGRNFTEFILFSAGFGIASAVFGVILGELSGFLSGPIVVIVAGIIFAVSLIFKR